MYSKVLYIYNYMKSSVENFYDAEWKQIRGNGDAKPISRHRFILKYLKKNGLHPKMSVLEVGCGAGQLSSLLIDYLQDGYFVGTDISEKTITYLQQRFAGKNATFVYSDMKNFQYDRLFDVIVFPDVLEHIPLSQHAEIFQTAAALLKETGFIFINNPDPRALAWYATHKPEMLQIIDQPLPLSHFTHLADSKGLYIERVESYSLYINEPEYQTIVMTKRKQFDRVTSKSKGALLLTNLKGRI